MALIPEFDIKGLEQKQDSKPNADTVNSSKNNQQSSQQQVDWYEEIRKWATELGRRPHFQEIKQKWHELTGQDLNEKGVTLLTFHGMWKRGLVREQLSRTNPLDLR